MTLTVRSATVTGATTKGSALTHAEMDENWNHVSNASGVTFTPPGSGALTEPVSTALQRLPHTAQYSTQGNYETARDALTGTIGVPSIDVTGVLTVNGDVTLGDAAGDTVTINGTTTINQSVTLASGKQFLAPNGSVTAPAYSFSGLTNHGLAAISTNIMALCMAADERFRFNTSSGLLVIPSDYQFSWSSTGASSGSTDLYLARDAANTLAQRNGTTAQAFRIYGTYTDASNYERGALNMGADYVEMAAETAGTGDDNLDVRLTPAGTGNVRFGTHSALAGETVSGYITVKDSAGNSRKLAVVS